MAKLAASEHKSPYLAIGSRVRRRYGGGDLTFRAFCAYLDAEGPYGNPHWYPQYRFIDALGAERLDFIGRVENLRTDLSQVIQKIFGYSDERAYRTGTTSGASGTRPSLVIRISMSDWFISRNSLVMRWRGGGPHVSTGELRPAVHASQIRLP